MVVGDRARTWRLAFHPGPLPLAVTGAGEPPAGDEWTERGFWSVVFRLTAPPGEPSVLDLGRLQRLRERLRDPAAAERGG